MINLQTLATFFGWCCVINIAVYLLSTLAILALRGTYPSLISRMFRVSETVASEVVFEYVGRYKLAIIVLNLVPYVALRIMLAG